MPLLMLLASIGTYYIYTSLILISLRIMQLILIINGHLTYNFTIRLSLIAVK